MGEAELRPQQHQLIIHYNLFFYGNAASEELSAQIAEDVTAHWNAANGIVIIKSKQYQVRFNIKGFYAAGLQPLIVYENTDPRNNYFRVEDFSHNEVSAVDGIGCNTGYFLLSNLLDHSTTAAHEYGHTLGLEHPRNIDIRGKGVPGIMYPRGTITDQQYFYSPVAVPHGPGGTMNPIHRKVLQQDIDDLKLHRLRFNEHGFAVVGEFSSVWHDAHTLH